MMLRLATPADVDGIIDVHVASWKIGYRGILPDRVLDEIDLNKRRARWLEALSKPPQGRSTLLCLDELQRMIGFATFGPARGPGDHGDADVDPLRTAELIACYVHPDHWRRGAGRLMCDEIFEQLHSRFQDIIVWVLRDNPRARGFYESIGFIEEPGRQKPLPWDWHQAELWEVRYRREL